MKKYMIGFLAMQDISATLSPRNFGNSNSSSRSVSPDRVLTPRTKRIRELEKKCQKLEQSCQEKDEKYKKEKEEKEQHKKNFENILTFEKRKTLASCEYKKVKEFSDGLQGDRNEIEAVMRHNEILAEQKTHKNIRRCCRGAKYVGGAVAIVGGIACASLLLPSSGILGAALTIANFLGYSAAIWPEVLTLVGGAATFGAGWWGQDQTEYYFKTTKKQREQLVIFLREFDHASEALLKISNDLNKYSEADYDYERKYTSEIETEVFNNMMVSSERCLVRMESSKKKVEEFLKTLIITEAEWTELKGKKS